MLTKTVLRLYNVYINIILVTKLQKCIVIIINIIKFLDFLINNKI